MVLALTTAAGSKSLPLSPTQQPKIPKSTNCSIRLFFNCQALKANIVLPAKPGTSSKFSVRVPISNTFAPSPLRADSVQTHRQTFRENSPQSPAFSFFFYFGWMESESLEGGILRLRRGLRAFWGEDRVFARASSLTLNYNTRAGIATKPEEERGRVKNLWLCEEDWLANLYQLLFAQKFVDLCKRQ